MDVVRLPKKFRDLCTAVQNGREPDPKTMTLFREKFPHQAAAVEAETAAFQGDWETVFEKEILLLPWLGEWYYSNVPAQQMTLLAFAARQLGRGEEAKGAFQKARADLLAEDPQAGGRNPRYTYAGYMLDYLETGAMPYDEELHYTDPEEPKSAEELKATLTQKEQTTQTGKLKLLNLCCLKGTAAEALALYEEVKEETLTEMWHQYAIQRYLYLGAEEEALQAAERWAASRLWAIAAPTQVRPVCFFQHPMLHPFLLDGKKLRRLREAAFRPTEEK